MINNETSNEENTVLEKDAKPIEDKKRKNKFVLVWTLILITIFSIIIGTLLICSSYDKRINGSWRIKDDEIVEVLTFKDDNKVIYSTDSLDLEGKYTLDGDKVNIDISLNGRSLWVSGDYSYAVNTSISEKTLNLKRSDDAFDIECMLYGEEAMRPENDFEPVDELLGEWRNEEGDMTYCFNKYGIGYFKKGNLTMKFTYKCESDNIIIKMIDLGTVQSINISYKFENDALIINNLSFIKK